MGVKLFNIFKGRKMTQKGKRKKRLCSNACNLNNFCLDCDKIKKYNKTKTTREYELKNKEKIKIRKNKYRIKNKDKICKQQKEYSLKNKEVIKNYHKKYNILNKEYISKYKKEYELKNKNKIKKRKKRYYIKNRDAIVTKRKIYYNNNKQKFSENSKKWRFENRDYNNNISKEYAKKRYHNDPIFKIKRIISVRVGEFLKNAGANKAGKAVFGCLDYSPIELKIYIESKFEKWMNWTNWGMYDSKTWKDSDPSTWTWNLDHIIPQSDFNFISLNDEQFNKCWALENLRPYSAKQNILDGNRRTT